MEGFPPSPFRWVKMIWACPMGFRLWAFLIRMKCSLPGHYCSTMPSQLNNAVGWMLREVGKRDLKTEEAFLKRHYKNMPRTMLRYAIERFPEPKRLKYLKGKI
ncbi:MAG: DNA alkylation repair protein [Deltaproteobacteria bacterium]|nr:DNA alkylation repair protein [Deltaproteobacteria bacterium]MBW1943254.1 DNA alkylation repair protein [Deltaproteobacteria bacterium]